MLHGLLPVTASTGSHDVALRSRSATFTHCRRGSTMHCMCGQTFGAQLEQVHRDRPGNPGLDGRAPVGGNVG
jgi:hypothetical protein